MNEDNSKPDGPGHGPAKVLDHMDRSWLKIKFDTMIANGEQFTDFITAAGKLWDQRAKMRKERK